MAVTALAWGSRSYRRLVADDTGSDTGAGALPAEGGEQAEPALAAA